MYRALSNGSVIIESEFKFFEVQLYWCLESSLAMVGRGTSKALSILYVG